MKIFSQYWENFKDLWKIPLFYLTFLLPLALENESLLVKILATILAIVLFPFIVILLAGLFFRQKG